MPQSSNPPDADPAAAETSPADLRDRVERMRRDREKLPDNDDPGLGLSGDTAGEETLDRRGTPHR